MSYTIRIDDQTLQAEAGETLLEVLRHAGLAPDAPCGGQGRCGKCRVFANGEQVLACRTAVCRDMTVTLPERGADAELTAGAAVTDAERQTGLLAAVDIGTTTVAACLLDGATGRELAAKGMKNPQAPYGADVISRIQAALNGGLEAQRACICDALTALLEQLCTEAGHELSEITALCVVGNPAMQQLFLGISPENLAKIPFSPLLTEARTVDAGDYLPALRGAKLLIVPDIAGYVGADTVGCMIATDFAARTDTALLLDIGTNGEMVLIHGGRMAACSAAAGPALEGANISCGMRAASGAIDRVWSEDGALRCHVLGGAGKAEGICGSGLVSAAAAALELGLIHPRGRIQSTEERDGERCIPLCDGVSLSQTDIRQLQLAKGAIAAGADILMEKLGAEKLDTILLAGAFGSFLDPQAARRIGLLPNADTVIAAGNAALGGAKALVCRPSLMDEAQRLCRAVEFVELASWPDFAYRFAEHSFFPKPDRSDDWLRQALADGFDEAAYIDPQQLTAQASVRASCAENRCRSYGQCWSCPPHCGELSDCEARMHGYTRGILLQTVGKLSKSIDTKGYAAAEQRHKESLRRFARRIRERHPNALCLGAGPCGLCERCAYPEPCRCPEQAMSSMEAYGLFVTEVCRTAGLPYHHGDKTITYTACILY